MPSPVDLRQRLIFPVVALVIGLGAPALVAELILRVLPTSSLPPLLPVGAANPILRFTPNRSFTYSLGWDFGLVNRGRTNNLGFVNQLDYDSTATSPLLAILGDSYVEALLVPFPQTMQGRLTKVVGGGGRVYSFGVSGAALSHYLAEAEYAKLHFHPQGMAVLVVGNDFDESLLRYAPRPGLWYFAERGDSGLSLQRTDYRPPWWRGLVNHSALCQYLLRNLGADRVISQFRSLMTDGRKDPGQMVGNTAAAADSVRLRLSHEVVDEFLRELPERSGLPPSRLMILVDAIRPNLYSASELQAATGSYFDVMRTYLIQSAGRLGYQVIDTQSRFLEQFRHDSLRFDTDLDLHWNGHGHEMAAQYIASSDLFRTLFAGAGSVTSP